MICNTLSHLQHMKSLWSFPQSKYDQYSCLLHTKWLMKDTGWEKEWPRCTLTPNDPSETDLAGYKHADHKMANVTQPNGPYLAVNYNKNLYEYHCETLIWDKNFAEFNNNKNKSQEWWSIIIFFFNWFDLNIFKTCILKILVLQQDLRGFSWILLVWFPSN